MSALPDGPYRGDPVFGLLLGRWRIGERGFAVLVALAGFGVLSVWYCAVWLADPPSRALRGLFDYYSATFGDLLLLPLVNLAAARYAPLVFAGLQQAATEAAPSAAGAVRLQRLVRHAYQRPAALAFALAISFAAVGLVHLDELYGGDRNWTVPLRGRPRAVAYYHQAFVGFQAYVAAFLVFRHVVTVRLVARLARNARRARPLALLAERSLRLFGWTLLGWGVFVSLRVLDFCEPMPVPSARALAALPTPLLVLGVYYAAFVLGGLWPLVVFGRRLRDGGARRGLALLIAAACAAPLLPPLACLLAPP